MWPAPAFAQAPQAVTVVDNVAFPAGIAFGPDGTMYFSERDGRIRAVRDGRLDPEPIAQRETTTAGETGFLGVAVSADDVVYVFATDPSGDTNSILRVPTSGGDLEPIVTGLPGGGYHNGGGIAFDDSGSLFISNGETHDSSRAQDPDALGGKVYRVMSDGTPVGDNPFGSTTTTYALGLRNPYGLAIDPVSQQPFVTENGPTGNDELNRIVAGGNYGWPAVEGKVGDIGDVEATLPGTYQDPLLEYPDAIVPTGIAFADPRSSESRYAGDLFFAAFAQRAIHRVRLDGTRTQATSDEIFVQERDPVIALAWGPEGLYYSTPSAIKVLPLAQRAPRATTPVVPDPPEPGGVRVGRVAFVLGAFALVLAFVMVVARYKRAGPSRPGPF